MSKSDTAIIIAAIAIPLIAVVALFFIKPRNRTMLADAAYRPAFKNNETYSIVRDESGFITQISVNREVETA